MAITVLAFGAVADLTGNAELQVGDVADTDALKALLQQQFPGLRHLTYAIAVDQRTVRDNTVLQSSSVVALLPPFSGG